MKHVKTTLMFYETPSLLSTHVGFIDMARFKLVPPVRWWWSHMKSTEREQQHDYESTHLPPVLYRIPPNTSNIYIYMYLVLYR